MAKKMAEISARDLKKMQTKIRKAEENKLKLAERKAKAAAKRKVDGLSSSDIEKISKAIRQIWSWSTPRRLCIARATGKDGFPICEKCTTKVPKVYPDHIIPVGSMVSGHDVQYIERMFTPSKNLQALCRKCHAKKTRLDNEQLARDRDAEKGFY